MNFSDPFGLIRLEGAAAQQFVRDLQSGAVNLDDPPTQAASSCGPILKQPGVINSANRVWRLFLADPGRREFAENLMRTASGNLFGVRVDQYTVQTDTSASFVALPGAVGSVHSHPRGGRLGLYGDWRNSIEDSRGGGIKIVVTADSMFLLPSYPALSFPAAVTEACARQQP